jgi:hypothetical protein
MKILLISNGRTGSYSICEWISKELNIKFITEIDDYFNYKVEDNFILKRTLSNNNFDLKDIIYFDKIIVLYRENTLKQSESSLYAILREKWHHSPNTIPDGYYELNEDFLKKNHEIIWETKYEMDKEKIKMLNLNFGLKISYEEIFEEKIGQKIISDYIDFNPKINLDFELKMRKENSELTYNSYEREIYNLKNKNEDKIKKLNTLSVENEELKTLLVKNEELIYILRKNQKIKLI